MTPFEFDSAELTRFGPHYTGDGRRYLLRLPATDKAKGWTRATTFAKTIDDESNLAPWKGTMGIVGVLTDRPTRTEWQALLAEHPDPWYAGPEAKERARELVEQASEAGGAGDRRDTGTALHTILHLIATGRALPEAVDEEWRTHVVNALTVLAEAGLRIVPELCELTVFNRIYDTIGRFDLICETLDDRYGIPKGSLCIADWKTGGATWRPKKDYKTKRQTGWYDGYDMSDGPHVGQLTLYASASDIVIWPEDKWDECRLIPMPAVSQAVGFIIHLPSNEPGNVTVRVLDLTIGRQWLDTCRLVRDTRKCKPLIERVGAHEPPVPDNPPTVVQPVDPFDGLTSTLVEQQSVPVAAASHGSQIFAASAPVAMVGAVTSTSGVPGEAKMPPAPNNQKEDDEQLAAVPDGSTGGGSLGSGARRVEEARDYPVVADSGDDPEAVGRCHGEGCELCDGEGWPCVALRLAERRAWIIGRLTVLQAVPGALDRVGQLWPDGIPTLKQSDSHTDVELDRIVAVIDQVEAEYTIPFGTPDPTTPKEESRWIPTSNDTPDGNRDSTPNASTSTADATSSKPQSSSTNTPPSTASTSTTDSATSSSSTPDAGPDPTTPKEEGRWTLGATASNSMPPTPTSHSVSDSLSSEPKPARTTPSRTPETSSTTSSEPPANARPSASTNKTINEGPDVDPDTIKTLEAAYTGLDGDGRTWIARIAHDAQTAGRPIHLSVPTVRRFEIVRGLVALAAGGYADDEILRAIVGLTLRLEQYFIISNGETLSGLHADEAQRFANLAVAFTEGRIAMHINNNGDIELTMGTT